MLYTKKQDRVVSQVKFPKTSNRLSVVLKAKKHIVSSHSSVQSNLSDKNQGFSLVELLVGMIIIGILSAIPLPMFLRQVNKAKEVEAITKVNNILKSQQEYYITDNEFAEESEIELPPETENYKYRTLSENQRINGSVILGLSKKPYLKSYVGVIFIKDGQQVTCPQIPLDINQTNFDLRILLLINDVIDNPKKYC